MSTKFEYLVYLPDRPLCTHRDVAQLIGEGNFEDGSEITVKVLVSVRTTEENARFLRRSHGCSVTHTSDPSKIIEL